MDPRKLKVSLDYLNEKLTALKEKHEQEKEENCRLKASVDNHIFINSKLLGQLERMTQK